MAGEQNQKPLKLRIYNNTQDITLQYRRFDGEDHNPPELQSTLGPCSSDRCQIPRDPGSSEIKQLVVYEADSFTLAIFVHIVPRHPKKLQLELSQENVHLRDLKATFFRMSDMLDPPDLDRALVTRCEFSGKGKASILLLAGPYKLIGTLSHYKEIFLKVWLESKQLVHNPGVEPCRVL